METLGTASAVAPPASDGEDHPQLLLPTAVTSSPEGGSAGSDNRLIPPPPTAVASPEEGDIVTLATAIAVAGEDHLQPLLPTAVTSSPECGSAGSDNPLPPPPPTAVASPAEGDMVTLATAIAVAPPASDGEDHLHLLLPTTIEAPPSYFHCLPNDVICLVAHHLKSSRLDVEHMRQTCRALRMAIPGCMGPWIVLSRRDPTAEARHTVMEISKGVEAADASLQRKAILADPPVGASCFGSAQGLLGMRCDQPHSRQSFLFCLLCGTWRPLIIFPEGMAPRSIYFWPAHEHSHFIVMVVHTDSDSMLFSDTIDWGGDWEAGINWIPYPGTEDHRVRSVAFYPGYFTAAATNECVVILDEHSRSLDRPEELIFLQAPVLDAGDPLLAWNQNGHHVFFCDEKLYLCVLVDSPTAAEGVVTWLFVMEKDEDMGYMLLPTTSIGHYSVYLGPNLAIVLPACDPFIGRLSNTVYVEDYRGLTRQPKVLAINLGTQVVISIPYPGDIAAVDEFLPAVWVCPPQYKDTFGHCGRR